MKRTCEHAPHRLPRAHAVLFFPSRTTHFRKSEWRRRSRLSRLLPLANAYTIHIARSSNDAPTRRTSVVLNATMSETLRTPFPAMPGSSFIDVISSSRCEKACRMFQDSLRCISNGLVLIMSLLIKMRKL